jgi:hypothetical protein
MTPGLERIMAASTKQVSHRKGFDTTLLLPPSLQCPHALAPFLRRAPLPVLVRSCLEWMLEQANLESLFEQTAQKQYTRHLTLDFLVNLMLDVACGIKPSAHAALKARREQIDISRQAFYAKLQRMELSVSEAIVGRFAGLAESIIAQWGLDGNEPIRGFAARVIDGTVLGGRTDHRIAPLRTTRAAGLTGHALAVYAVAQRTVRQVVLDEDAYTQERAMLAQVQVRAGEVWIGDRNFCVRSFLFRLHREGAAFVIRRHAQNCPYEECGPLAPAIGSVQGALEQPVRLTGPDTKETMTVRRIVLPLASPIRNGERELVLLTDLPESVPADTICDAYRGRWQIETHFQRLTRQLHCEPEGLDHPRAALFAFAMAVVAANALAVVQAALQVAHGTEAVRELSYYALVLHIAEIWLGMDVVAPDEQWTFARNAKLETLAAWLLALARQVRMEHFQRSRRGPKKPPPEKQPTAEHTHFSNKRLLDQARNSPYNSP